MPDINPPSGGRRPRPRPSPPQQPPTQQPQNTPEPKGPMYSIYDDGPSVEAVARRLGAHSPMADPQSRPNGN